LQDKGRWVITLFFLSLLFCYIARFTFPDHPCFPAGRFFNCYSFSDMPRYTPEQLSMRNASVWTDIQIILAPVQFLIFIAGVTITTLFANGILVNGFYWVSLAIQDTVFRYSFYYRDVF